ncbi:MAG: radical SAM protein, partial [bacterium]
TGLVPHLETVHDRLTVEIRRGCTRGCRFCQPGMLTRPARDVEPDAVIEAVEEGMRRTGYADFSLLSLSCSDYLALPAVGVELRNRLADKNVSLTLPSQRVDRFDRNIAHILGGTRRAGLTFAPEAGTQRLRDIVNKGLTDEELLRGIRTAMETGYRKVKLYFMIGLPGETDADVLGIA